MKHLFVILFMLSGTLSGLSQQKGAQINLTSFAAAGNSYTVQCAVSFYAQTTNAGSGNFLLFFLQRNGNNPLELLQVYSINKPQASSYFKMIPGQNTYQLILVPKTYIASGFSLFPVLVSGNEAYLNKAAAYVSNEFSQINDVLNVLYKSQLTPLTYSVNHQ